VGAGFGVATWAVEIGGGHVAVDSERPLGRLWWWARFHGPAWAGGFRGDITARPILGGGTYGYFRAMTTTVTSRAMTTTVTPTDGACFQYRHVHRRRLAMASSPVCN